MPTPTPEPIGPNCALGECPLWDARTGHLYLIDIDGQAVHRCDLSTGATETRLLTGRPGSMVLTSDPDRLVVGVEHQLMSLSWSSGAATQVVDVEPEGPGKRLNDGRCDPAGRYWVGSMDDPHDAGIGRGRLHRIQSIPGNDPGGFDITEHRSDIRVSNAMAFSPEGTVMYWADTPTKVVWRYDVDPDTGERHGEAAFVDFSGPIPGLPDGACVDDAGCYWVACVTGGAVARVTPRGAIDKLIELPVTMPTMPAFGGPDLDILFVTSINDDPQGRSNQEGGTAGRIDAGGGTTLMLEGLGFTGIPEPVFVD